MRALGWRLMLIWGLGLGWLYPAKAQLATPAVPVSVTAKLPAVACLEEVQLPNHDNCGTHQLNALQVACPVTTSFHPANSGEWANTPNGRVWRIILHVPQARSLYLQTRFRLQPGVKLFIYSPDYQVLYGAFSHRNNNPTDVFTVAPVPGNMLVAELNVPSELDTFGIFEITTLWVDHTSAWAQSRINQARTASCQENVNCENGLYWQTEKRSVCKILVNGMVGTGTLVANTSGNATPYILTAAHLISNAAQAAAALFLFNDEISCDGSMIASASLSGAELVATAHPQLDFVLLKPYQSPPPSYRTYYAGWDTRPKAPASGVCIHHAFGETKQIAIEYHPLQEESIGLGFDAQSTWKVPHWELGTTELGSSGAPLFNPQHRLTGTLTGGRSTCGYARDDYFTKLASAWASYPEASRQVRHWLDPQQTGTLTMNGYDPYGFDASHCDTAWNFTKAEPMVSENVDGQRYSRLAERFRVAGALQLNGVYLHPATVHAASTLAGVELTIWVGDRYPETAVFSRWVFLRDLIANQVNFIPLDTILHMDRSFFVGCRLASLTSADTLTLFQTQNRGAAMPASAWQFQDRWVSTSASWAVGVSTCYGIPQPPATTELVIFPNPAHSQLQIKLPENTTVYDLKCFDSSGKPVSVQFTQNEQVNQLDFNLKPGLYLLKMRTSQGTLTSRFMVSPN